MNVGRRVEVRADSYFYLEGALDVGDDVFFNRNFYLSALSNIVIGDRVRFGERCSIHDENHHYEPLPLSKADRARYDTAPVIVGSDVWVGANSVILPGASIGNGSVIGANSVVRGHLPSRVLAAGAPARVVRELRSKDDHTSSGDGTDPLLGEAADS